MTQDSESDREAAVMRLWRRHVHGERVPGHVPPEADLAAVGGARHSDCVVVVTHGPHAGTIGLLMNFREGERRVVSADTTESVAVKPKWVRIATLEERLDFAEAETRGAPRALEARRADAITCGYDVAEYVEGCMEPVPPRRSIRDEAPDLLKLLSDGVRLQEKAVGVLRGTRDTIEEQLENAEHNLAMAKSQHDALRKEMAAAGLLLSTEDLN